MRVIGLDGRSYSWNVSEYERNQERSCSSYHDAARQLLQRMYPCDRILEELTLPGSDGLVADFYLPTRKLLVEVHGPQHYRFVTRFHKDVLDFWSQRRRDEQKKEWCEINGIGYIELPWNQQQSEWEKRILNI